MILNLLELNILSVHSSGIAWEVFVIQRLGTIIQMYLGFNFIAPSINKWYIDFAFELFFPSRPKVIW